MILSSLFCEPSEIELNPMEETRTVRDVVQDEILTERTQRYRRNVMALSIVAISILGFDFVDFKNLSLFGLKIQENHWKPKTIALSVLWLMIAYNFSFFAYRAHWDRRQWIKNLTAFRENRKYFPELQMFKGEGYGPKNQYSYTDPPIAKTNLTPSWHHEQKNKTAAWTCRLMNKHGDTKESYRHYLPSTLINNVNEKNRDFYILETGIPVGLFLAALILADRAIF